MISSNVTEALKKFSEKYNVDPEVMEHTLRTTVFKQKDDEEITKEQMLALIVVASQYDLNPFTKEIYAYPDRKGIIPVVGVDGWSRLINSNKYFDGMDFNQSEKSILIEKHAKTCPEWIEVSFYRKDRSHPIVVREYLDEVYKIAYVKGNYVVKAPWQTHTKRMLRHKVMIQGARIAFGFAGIYDEDEADNIVNGNVDIVKNNDAKSIIDKENDKTSDILKKVENEKFESLCKKIKSSKNINDLKSLTDECSNLNIDFKEKIRMVYKEKLETFKVKKNKVGNVNDDKQEE